MTNFPFLHQVLPHDTPLILIDELIDVGETHIHCRVAPSERNLFFNTSSRTIPGYVGIEFIAQSIAAWSGYHAWTRDESPPIGFLLGSRRYQSNCSAFNEHQILDIHAEQMMENNGMAVFSCTIKHQEQVLANCQINVFVPTQEKLNQMLSRDSL